MKYIQGYLKTLVCLFIFSNFMLLTACGSSENNYTNETEGLKIDPFKVAKEFYDAVKAGRDAEKYTIQLKEMSKSTLESELKTDSQKKAFWLNIYNTYVQYLLKDNPKLYEERSEFFKTEFFIIAGEKLSLDDVEHGFIRDSRVKKSLGILKDPFASKFEKTFRVSEVDWRIHFALNCGAKSCPPVTYYNVETLDEELEKSAKTYLTKEVEYKKDEDKVYVPALMSWFRADFGGKDGALEIVKKYGLVPQDVNPSVEFLDYNWELDVDNYN